MEQLNDAHDVIQTSRHMSAAGNGAGGANRAPFGGLSVQSLSSLYDSLASELEAAASDSGFQATPATSTRVRDGGDGGDSGRGNGDGGESEAEARAPSIAREQPPVADEISLFRLDLSRFDRGTNDDGDDDDVRDDERTLQQLQIAASSSRTLSADYCDVPSPAIVDAVRRSLNAERRRRGAARRPIASASQSPRELQQQQPTNDELAAARVSTRAAATCTSSSPPPPSPPPPPQPRPIDFGRPDDHFRVLPNFSPRTDRADVRDASCSPIHFYRASPSPSLPLLLQPPDEPPPDEPTPRETTSAAIVELSPPPPLAYTGDSSSFAPATTSTASDVASTPPPASDDDDEAMMETAAAAADAKAEATTPSSAVDLLLASYSGPARGCGGEPGTRDLEYSLRRLEARKQVCKFSLFS